MKEPRLLPEELSARSLGTRLRAFLLPVISALVCVLAISQVASLWILLGRLEVLRGRLDSVEVETRRSDSLLTREVELLKSRVQVLVKDYALSLEGDANGQYFLHSPPHPPPLPPFTKHHTPHAHKPPIPPEPPASSTHHAHRDRERHHSRASHGRAKRRASDPSYGVNGGVDDGGGELSVKLQGEDTENRSEDDDSWLKLTSYARMPRNTSPDKSMDKEKHDALQEFCKRTGSSCPPGPVGLKGETGVAGKPGPEGMRGLPGNPGPRGIPGVTGLPGIPGAAGLRGPRGEKGKDGFKGMDGRDGLPGEPGLDGIPGRNGLDGVPGFDGMPGHDGMNGINGTDGSPGPKGDRGLRGPQGVRGIAGPRGNAGKNGLPGRPGEPGIQTWTYSNGSDVSTLLIPPSIPGSTRTRPRRRKPIVVREGDNLRLKCRAAGEPRPRIEWSREEGGAIPSRQWKEGSLNSEVLNLTHVRREHTGQYRCEAYNGIPPNDYKTFNVEVHFDPYLRIKQWKIGTYNGSSARMECHVEAFPLPVTFWEDQHGRILDNSSKHSIAYLQDPNNIWKSVMLMNISNVDASDFGDYHCVAKNELSITRGLIKVHEIDPNLYVPSTGTVDGLTFGPDPPQFADLYEEPCQQVQKCPDCPKCAEGRGALYGLQVGQFGNDTYPGFAKREIDCQLSAVGKPVYHRHTDSDYGSWLRDPIIRDPAHATKYWTTSPTDTYHLYEFNDKNAYRMNKPSKNYTFEGRQFTGNSHVVYNGSFFYHQANSQLIIKHDLSTGNTKSVLVPEVAFKGDNYLYGSSRDYIDLATDENGLWAIYGLPSNNNTIVMKLDPATLKVEYSWNISLSHHKFGELFITCGVLYAVDSTTERDTKIRFALDLYQKRLLDVDLPFNNPFTKTTMLGYNPNTREIYSWDSGNQLTYPTKYSSMELSTTEEERSGDTSSLLTEYSADDPDYEVDELLTS